MTDAVYGGLSRAHEVCGETAFVILTWNQRETTRRCLQSIERAGYPLDRVVLWDNGSTDGTDQMVYAEFPAVTYHHHPNNKGVASGRNSAARLALRALSPSYLLFLDNDMVVTEGLLEALGEPFAANARQAQSVAKIRFLDVPETIQSAGGQQVNFALGLKRGIGYAECDHGQYDTTRECLPSGGATLVSADVFLRLDGFDSVFDPFGSEDLDFALRVRKAGYQSTYVPEALVYHDYTRKTPERNGGRSWIAARVHHWFILLHRHASLPECLAFFLGGGLVGLARVASRQFARGNPDALRGVPAGVRDFAEGLPRSRPLRRQAGQVGIETD